MTAATKAKITKPKIDSSIARTRERGQQKRLTAKAEAYNYAVSRRSVIQEREKARQKRQESVLELRRVTASDKEAARIVSVSNTAKIRQQQFTERQSQRESARTSNLLQRQAFRRQQVTADSDRSTTRSVIRAAPQAIPNTVSGDPSPVAAGIFRIFAIFFLLSVLFLLVSRGDQAGNAIQKVGFFLNNLTSNQPLIVKKTG